MKKSFTIVELIVVIIIIGIVSVFIANSINDLGRIRISQAAYRLKSDIRFAQQYAISSGNRTLVSFNPSTENYTVYYEDGSSNWVTLTHPYTHDSFTVELNHGEYSGTDIVTTYFGAANNSLVFDKKGIPYYYNQASGSTTILSSTGNITINNVFFIKVEPKTGKVWLE